MILGSSSQASFIASRRYPQKLFFSGYFFDGSNYISDLDGLNEYSDETHFSIRSGLDGCYAFGRRLADETVFGNDFSGYKTLFYYHDGDVWAVGDSLWGVIEELRELGVTVVPDYAQLGSIVGTNSTNNQMFSWNTVARGVKLLPRGATLRIREGRAVVEQRLAQDGKNYPAELQSHIGLWLDRYATLLTDGRVEVSIDLTGGVDSRTNFALAQRVRDELGNAVNLPRYTCSGVPGVSADASVAAELCNQFGLSLNPRNRISPYRVDPDEGFNLWKRQSLGVYYPLVIPATRRHAARVHMSGGGGEIHRDYYARATVDEFFRGHMQRNKYPWLGFEAGEVGYRDALAASAGRDESPLRANYREFRHRLHSGRSARQSTSFTPLDSATAERANISASRTGGFEAYFNYDILGTLAPALLDVPFDKPSKSPSKAMRSKMSCLAIGEPIRPGRAYGGFAADSGTAQGGSYSASARMVPFAAAVDAAAELSSVRTFWGEEVVQSAKEIASSMKHGGSIGNPVHGHPISAVLSAAMVAPENVM